MLARKRPFAACGRLGIKKNLNSYPRDMLRLPRTGAHMEYRTVFDIASAGYKSWTFPMVGLIFIFVGALVVAVRRHLPGWWGKHPTASNIFAFSFLGFTVAWTLVSFFGTYRDYSSASGAMERNHALVAEGIVSDFKPMPVTGHAMESFCVSGKCFRYSDYAITAGFNNTSSHGGPIRQGLPVRVTYVGNTILKLEVPK